MSVVIYLFVSPSGRAYAGRHTCQHEGWPRRGSGALPSGYRGSGKLWANVTRRHGPAIRWIILRRFGPDAARTDIDAAERRAIRLARAMWGEMCVNLLEGGQGIGSLDAHQRWSDPGSRKKMMEGVTRALADPDIRQRHLVAMHRPEVRERHLEALAASWGDPQTRAKRLEHLARLNANTAMQTANRGHLAAARAATLTPEAKAKRAATFARNKARRAMEEQQ